MCVKTHTQLYAHNARQTHTHADTPTHTATLTQAQAQKPDTSSTYNFTDN